MILKIICTPKLNRLITVNNLEFISKISKTQLANYEDYIQIIGSNAPIVYELLEDIEEGEYARISEEELQAMYTLKSRPSSFSLPGLMINIKMKNNKQREYIKLLETNDIVFAYGCAGTGKTHIAAALGLNALMTRSVDRLILSRPAVEAGEKLGFLPGELKNKFDPFLRPLYDELTTWLPMDSLDKYISQGKIEIAPLAYMRGRTLKKSWIILDEGQNTTIDQMKMFLTRFGIGSKMVITGDDSQVDLHKKQSGLADAVRRLERVKSIGSVYFDRKSIVRHPILTDIIQAYSD